jgi:hypothetical protein
MTATSSKVPGKDHRRNGRVWKHDFGHTYTKSSELAFREVPP